MMMGKIRVIDISSSVIADFASVEKRGLSHSSGSPIGPQKSKIP